MMHGNQQLRALRALWQAPTATATRRAGWALGAVLLVAATLVSRIGSDAARLIGLLALVAAPLPWLWAGRRRRQQANPRALLRATLLHTQPDLGAATLRALSLQESTATDPSRGSAMLAELHLVRLLSRASPGPLSARASRVGWRFTLLALLLAGAALAVVLADPFRMLEGLDVLAAHRGTAPVALRWVEPPELSAVPPSYLGLPHRPLRPYFPAALPAGTIIEVRAQPLHAGRPLVLTDGHRELPFHDDGRGGAVAHWPVAGDAELSIAARFGEVLVREPERLEIHALPDYAPHVRLAGAPATHRLLDHPRLPIHWEVTDDHGLGEVALVLRAGEREQRRTLSKPRGGATVDRGGIELRANDPFLRRTHLPVEVTVEALDTDPVGGPKWGRSQPIVLVPPAIAEAEALRYAALADARDDVTDVLAVRLTGAPAATTAARTYAATERRRHHTMSDHLQQMLNRRFGSLRFDGWVRALVRGQIELVDGALVALGGQPVRAGHHRLVRLTEQLVLAVDSVLGAVGSRDTQSAALEMATVALDAAAAIRSSREPLDRRRAERKLRADLSVLTDGGRNLLRLGDLGLDLGERVASDLRRIRGAWQRGDRQHARLAAEDLAARLLHPQPSFGAAGGHAHGGVEAGGGGSPHPASNAAGQVAEVERAIAQLAEHHQAEQQAVQKALDEALDSESRRQLEAELREQAKAVRQAISGLPQQASQPDSARAAAAQARSQAEGMAAALERTDLDRAVEQGAQAMRSLGRAMRRGASSPEGSSEQAAGEAAHEAHDALGKLLEQGRRRLAQTRSRASEAARSQLERSGEREQQMAERAREIARQSSDSDAPLPGEMLRRLGQAGDAMDRAGRALGQGRGHQGLEQQKQAQRLLEMSQPEADHHPKKDAQDGPGREFARDAEIPGASKDPSAAAFRKRVTAGMRHRTPTHLREAARRYAEGLLR